MKTKQIFLSVFYVISLALIFTSCTKELPQKEINPDEVLTMREMQVDQDFEFKTTQTLNLKIVSSDYLGLPATKIEVFNGNPNENGQIFKTGITNREQVFEAQFDVSSSLTQLYVRRSTFDGNIETVTLDITSELVEYTFVQLKSSDAFKGTTAGPGCDSCTESIDEDDSGKLAVDEGETICILAGVTFEGEVDLDGGTLVVCGTLILEKIKGEGTIIINEDGVFKAEDLALSRAGMVVINYSQAFTVDEEPAVTGFLKNYGKMNLGGLDVGASGTFHNYEGGTVNISDDLVNLNSCINDGLINVSGDVENTNGLFENNCKLIIVGDLKINSEFQNASYVEIGGKLDMSTGPLVLLNQALIETEDIEINSAIIAEGNAYCKITVSGETDISSSGSFSGKLNFWDEDGIEDNDGNMGDDVTFDNAYIPATYCNPGSNLEGVALEDSDSDGVFDFFDNNPFDATTAFDNIYPSANNWGSLVFEDLWPYMGDFDFNDMVVDYQFNQKTDASDNVVEIDITLKVRAIGAAFKNGFGIQLPVVPAAIENVSGDFSHTQGLISLNANNTERNQDNAVIIFFDNAFDILPHPGESTGVNTTIGAPYVTPIEINFVITLAYPIASEKLGTPPYNAFIFTNGNRGKEIHLKNNAPTSLADRQNFGAGSDISNENTGIYYQTENGLPWAINFVDSFDYPAEKSDIINAYLHFADWAMSGGTTYADWYTDRPGYRNNTLIY